MLVVDICLAAPSMLPGVRVVVDDLEGEVAGRAVGVYWLLPGVASSGKWCDYMPTHMSTHACTRMSLRMSTHISTQVYGRLAYG